MQFGMCNEFCEGWDFERVCRLAHRTGYDGVEIAPFTISDSVLNVGPAERRRLRDTAQAHGLAVIGLHWLLVKPEGLHLNSPDPLVRSRTVDYLRAETDFSADLGGSLLVVGSPRQRNVPEGETYEQVWERSVATFRALAEHAAGRSVRLCIEPLGAQETNFICTAAEARRLVEAVDRPAFRMVLDVKAMCQDEEPIPDIIRRSAPYLDHVHANDASRKGPGFGETDFRPIAAALKEVGYQGFVSVEVFDFSAGPERIAAESLRYLRGVFA